MLFKSPVFSQASGSIAGITYSHNRSGMYTRSRTIPTDPTTTLQTALRMYMATAAAAWHAQLSAANRASWEAYAAATAFTNKLGDQVYLTGQQQWCRTAVPYMQGGGDPVSDFATAPTTFDYGEPGVVAVTGASAATQVISFSIGGSPGWAADDNAFALVYAGFPRNPSVNFYKGPYRYVNFVAGNTMTPITTGASSALSGEQAFVAGQAVFACIRVMQSDGRLTMPMRFRVIAGA